MSDLPQGFAFEDLYVYRDGETFFFVPGSPVAERSPTGEPTLSVMGSQTFGFLQLGAEWTAPQDVLDRLTKFILKNNPDVQAPVRLVMAPLRVLSIDLVLEREGNAPEVLQSQTQLSSIGPIKALFSVSLDQSHRTQVLDALEGKKGKLSVVVNATLDKGVQASFRISGDVSGQLSVTGSGLSVEDCRKVVDDALEAGVLKGQGSADQDAPAQLLGKASEIATQKAAEIVQRMISGGPDSPDFATIKAEAVARDTVPVPVQRDAKVSDWFSGGGKPRVFTTAGTPD